MSGATEPPVVAPPPPPPVPDFSVSSQNVDLDVDFLARTISGKTEITIIPHQKDLKSIRLNCRELSLTSVTVEGKQAHYKYNDPYQRLSLSSSSNVHSHQLLNQKIEGAVKYPPDEELSIFIPRSVQIQELDPLSDAAQELLLSKSSFGVKAEDDETAANLEAPALRAAADHGKLYTPLKVTIEFITDEIRDGLQFVGLKEGDTRYPHVYTRNSPFPGTACCLFPCVDSLTARCPWTISVRCPRTIGDAFKKPAHGQVNGLSGHATNGHLQNGLTNGVKHGPGDEFYDYGFNDEEMGLDLMVVCSGEMTDDIVDPHEPTRKTVSFQCKSRIAARHIGFAIGPFEHVDLSEFRESAQDEKLGDQAIRVHGFCLPGRTEDVSYTCMMMAQAIDSLAMKYTSYPFSDYKMCFVDDLPTDVAHTASLSICSSRLLYPKDILEPQNAVTRTLVHALATQWSGVNVVPKERADSWVIVGCAYFMTDMFLRELFGNNEFRFQQKLAADKVYEADVSRPSIHALGEILALDPSELDFLAIKAPLVLFILHMRLIKVSGRNGVDRIIYRYFINNKTDDSATGTISTQAFFRHSEKVGHQKLDAFFKQWVYGAGCPYFYVTQKFNKKKLVVEMTISQAQARREVDRQLQPTSFRREVKEDVQEVYAGELQPLFTGPMTIRIHEADGTPYEHIVDIKEVTTKFEIPYNTKYKRLKRSRRQKERAAAAQGLDISGDAQDDVLLYCLGDVLQAEEEVREWKLIDWSKEDEERMAQESFEWIRIDKDFEWICKISFAQPHYMWVSQLQQDNDVVAQVESIQYLSQQNPHPMISTILVRTLMDQRYFNGIRILAADALSKLAIDELEWIGLYHLEKAFQEFFCFPNSPMTRSNDFSDQISYRIQCAIPKAIAKVRDNNGRATLRVKQFFVDKLKFNDNTNNEWSDCHYVATLMECLGQCLATGASGGYSYSFGDDEEDDEDEEAFQMNAIHEIERYRRIDEWLSSYHNIYTITALECQKLLTKSRVKASKPQEFLMYTRPGNADEVRLKAFHCLVEMDMFRLPAIMKYIFFVFSRDPSPYIRERLWRMIWEALGHIAIGTSKIEAKAHQQQSEGFVIEGSDELTEARKQEIARTQTVPGAINALKAEIGENPAFKAALRDALMSNNISLQEFSNLLCVCSLLYTAENTLIVKLKLPRYYKVAHLGRGKLKFSRTNKYRTKPLPPPGPPGPPLKPHPASRSVSPTLKRKNSIQPAQPPAPQPHAMAPPPLPPPPTAPVQKISPEPPRKKRKLVVSLHLPKEKLAAFPSGPSIPPPGPTPRPTPERKSSSSSLKVKMKAEQSHVVKPSPAPPKVATPPPATTSENKPSFKIKLKFSAPKPPPNG